MRNTPIVIAIALIHQRSFVLSVEEGEEGEEGEEVGMMKILS